MAALQAEIQVAQIGACFVRVPFNDHALEHAFAQVFIGQGEDFWHELPQNALLVGRQRGFAEGKTGSVAEVDNTTLLVDLDTVIAFCRFSESLEDALDVLAVLFFRFLPFGHVLRHGEQGNAHHHEEQDHQGRHEVSEGNPKRFLSFVPATTFDYKLGPYHGLHPRRFHVAHGGKRHL